MMPKIVDSLIDDSTKKTMIGSGIGAVVGLGAGVLLVGTAGVGGVAGLGDGFANCCWWWRRSIYSPQDRCLL